MDEERRKFIGSLQTANDKNIIGLENDLDMKMNIIPSKQPICCWDSSCYDKGHADHVIVHNLNNSSDLGLMKLNYLWRVKF